MGSVQRGPSTDTLTALHPAKNQTSGSVFDASTAVVFADSCLTTEATVLSNQI